MTLSHYYIYYPVRIGLEADLARTLHNLQADVGEQTGIAGRFLRKADDPWTWMEIYALEQAIARHGVLPFIDEGASRHTERFVACA